MSFYRWTGFEVTRDARLSKFVGSWAVRVPKDSELLMCFPVSSLFITRSTSSAIIEGGDLDGSGLLLSSSSLQISERNPTHLEVLFPWVSTLIQGPNP